METNITKSFEKNLYGMAYAENGVIQAYTSKVEAKKIVSQLMSLGYDVVISKKFPYIIYLNPRSENPNFIVGKRKTIKVISRETKDKSLFYSMYEAIFKRIENCNNSEEIKTKFVEQVGKYAIEIIEDGIKYGIEEMISDLEEIVDEVIDNLEIYDEETMKEYFADAKYQEEKEE